MVHVRFIYIALLALLKMVLGIVRQTRARDMLEIALMEAIRRHRLEGLRRSLGSTNLDLTPDELFTLRSQS